MLYTMAVMNDEETDYRSRNRINNKPYNSAKNLKILKTQTYNE